MGMVHTVREHELLEALAAGVDVRSGKVTAIDEGEADALTVRVDGTEDIGADFVVLAHGGGGGGGVTDAPVHEVSFSGIVERDDGGPAAAAAMLPFETLSERRRFACVPLSRGGFFWFATAPAIDFADMPNDAFEPDVFVPLAVRWQMDKAAQDAPKKGNVSKLAERFERAGARTVPHTLGRWDAWPQQLDAPQSLGDLAPPQRAAVGRRLASLFGGWHSPVEEVVRWATKPDAPAARHAAVLIEPVRATAAAALPTWEGAAPGGAEGNSGGIAIDAAVLGGDLDRPWRVAAVGDAAQALPHNLAQGAAAAVEDAADLAASLRGLAAGEHGGKSSSDAAAAYAHARRARGAAHAQMTRFTAALGGVDGRAETLRNAVLRAVPAAINQRVFDAALAHSLGGGDR